MPTYFVIVSSRPRYPDESVSLKPAETISPEQAASLVKSGIWLDYGATHCEPDVFDKALAAQKDELENVKIRSPLDASARCDRRRP
jgi:acyl-CoA hydrolase